MSYLKNDICIFEPLQKINYNIKKLLLVTSLFKLSSGPYKNFSNYLSGIKILNNFANKYNMEVRIFIDNTIKEDKEIMNFLNSLNKVTLVLYNCNYFRIGNYHVGLFGTLVRFFPMFDFENNDAKYSFIVDADATLDRLNSMLDLYNLMLKIDNVDKLHLTYIGRYFHVATDHKIRQFIHNKKTYSFPYCIAQRIIGIAKIPPEPLVKFINKLKLYMDNINRPSSILSDYYIAPKDFKIKCKIIYVLE
jgi:hypothetical protein